jgi:hypothetical protein
MIFVTAKAFNYLASFVKLGKRRKARNRFRKTRSGKQICRSAHTDYRLAYDRRSEEWLLFLTACIRLEATDVDFAFFDECGRTGVTQVTIHGCGAMEFDEEEMPSDEEDYVFAEHPVLQSFPYRPLPYQPSPAATVSHDRTVNAVLIEMA